MAKSNIGFHRWGHIQSHTWPFQVYKLYNEELSGFIWSQECASSYTYSQLKKDGAQWTDTPTQYFSLPAYRIMSLESIKGWSDTYGESRNWMRLNCVLAISSNLETFLASVIALAIESNPGVLLGASKSIDGVRLLKEGTLDNTVYKSHIVNCTKSDWTSRLAAFESLFGQAPPSFRSSIPLLERIRKMRNNLGHAFGRDIESSRNFSFNTKQKTDRIQQETLVKYLGIAYELAKDIDDFLLDNHIGGFQAIYAYHLHYNEFSLLKNVGDRALALKKFYGRNDQLVGKVFCRGLVNYYERL